jgi:CubicO group peptidase (beta-lactamase class C family)
MISFIDKLDSENEPYLLHSMIEESTKANKFIGLGFQLYSIGGKKAIGHFGGDSGFRSYLVIVPDEKIGLVVLANCDYHEEFREQIIHQVLKAMREN